mmetsp:Transcript_24876/g.45479  ORF Transcript_24876/g.45479 Transcript_24876/m.45479 type:complete len:310 (-) Transcript_24876:396-1325(-)
MIQHYFIAYLLLAPSASINPSVRARQQTILHGSERPSSSATSTDTSRRAAIHGTPAILSGIFSFRPNYAIAGDNVDYNKFSSSYDDLDGGPLATALGLTDLRSAVVGKARGRCLEVGVGTGLNLRFYRTEQVESLDAVDLSPGMLAECRARLSAGAGLGGNEGSNGERSPEKVRLSKMDVAALSFPDATFDTVLDTFSLCVFPDPQAALREMARVCKPKSEGGRVLLLEHSRIDDDEEDGGDGRGRRRMLPKILAAYQDLTAAPIAAMGKGCVWNQRLEPLLASAGLEVLSSTRVLGGLLTVIEATRRG